MAQLGSHESSRSSGGLTLPLLARGSVICEASSHRDDTELRSLSGGAFQHNVDGTALNAQEHGSKIVPHDSEGLSDALRHGVQTWPLWLIGTSFLLGSATALAHDRFYSRYAGRVVASTDEQERNLQYDAPTV